MRRESTTQEYDPTLTSKQKDTEAILRIHPYDSNVRFGRYIFRPSVLRRSATYSTMLGPPNWRREISVSLSLKSQCNCNKTTRYTDEAQKGIVFA